MQLGADMYDSEAEFDDPNNSSDVDAEVCDVQTSEGSPVAISSPRDSADSEDPLDCFEGSMDWFAEHHRRIMQQRIASSKIEDIQWKVAVSSWSEVLKDISSEDLTSAVMKRILQSVRFTPSDKPMMIEILRKLGSHIVDADPGKSEDEHNEFLLEQLKPTTSDSICYQRLYNIHKWDKNYLKTTLTSMRGCSFQNLEQDIFCELKLGAIHSHVRSNRYHHWELAIIIESLLNGIEEEEKQDYLRLAAELRDTDANDETIKIKGIEDAKAFIGTCLDNLFRSQLAWQSFEKREFANGVLLFGDGVAFDGASFIKTDLDKLWEKVCHDEGLLAQKLSVKGLQKIVRIEGQAFDAWLSKRQQSDPNAVIKKHAIFNFVEDMANFKNGMHQALSHLRQYCKKKEALREFANKSTRKTCVSNVMRELKISTTERTNEEQGRKKIAVFGFKLERGDQNQPSRIVPAPIPDSVVVRKLSVQESEGETDESIEFYEIGLSLHHHYVQIKVDDEFEDELNDVLKTSALDIQQHSELVYFESVPRDTFSAMAETLDKILPHNTSDEGGRFDQVLLAINDQQQKQDGLDDYFDIGDAGGRFLIDLKRSAKVKTEGMVYTPLAVDHAASKCELQGLDIPFRRMSVLLPPSFPKGYDLSGLTRQDCKIDSAPFSESAEIIGEVLGLVCLSSNATNATYRKKIKEVLQAKPLLLYYTSIHLLNSANPEFSGIIAEYWKDRLVGAQVGYFELSIHEREARDIVLKLITNESMTLDSIGTKQRQLPQIDAAVSSAGSTSTPRHPTSPSTEVLSHRQDVNGGESGTKIALATEAHWGILSDIVRKETKFAQKKIQVEESNFESTKFKLRKEKPTSLTFYFLEVVGRMPPDQINHLMEQFSANTNMKVVLLCSPSILELLEMTSAIGVYKPESIAVSMATKNHEVEYGSSGSPFGSAVLQTFKNLCEFPEHILKPGQYWSASDVLKEVRGRVTWDAKIVDWSLSSEGEEETFVKLCVTSDFRATREELKARFEQENLECCCVDAGDDTEFYKMKELLDGQLLRASVSPHLGNTKDANPDSLQRLRSSKFVVVVSRASFLPHSRLEALVSRCHAKQVKLVLLVSRTEATNHMTRFRITHEENNVRARWIRVEVVIQRFSCAELASGHSRASCLAFRGLQLLFSLEFMTGHYSKVLQYTRSRDLQALEFLDSFEGVGPNCIFLKDFICELMGEEIELDDSGHTVLAIVLARHICRYLQHQDRQEEPISYVDFCRQPLLRLLSHIHRLEAYVAFLFHHTPANFRVSAQDGTPLGFPLVCNFINIVSNVQSCGPGKLLCAVYCPKKAVEVGAHLPLPKYVDPGRGDAIIGKEEVTERKALGGLELAWEDLNSEWRKGPDLMSDALDHLFVYSELRVPILLSMTHTYIINLNVSSRAARAIHQDLSKCNRLLRNFPLNQFEELRVRVAAIWWALITLDQASDRDAEEFFLHDQALLLQRGMTIDSKNNQSGRMLLGKVLPAVMRLDDSEALLKQRKVTDFLLDDDNADTVDKVLADDSVMLGRAFWKVCVSKEVLSKVVEQSCGNAIFSRLSHLLRWIRDPESPAENRHEKLQEQIREFAVRITPQGLCCLLESAGLRGQNDWKIALDCIVEPILAAQGTIEDRKVYIENLLQPLCSEASTAIAIPLIDGLANSHHQHPEPQLEGVDEYWALMFNAMKLPLDEEFDPDEEPQDDGRDALESFFTAVVKAGAVLPFQISDRLCQMYFFYCRNLSTSSEQLARHAAVLQSRVNREKILHFLEHTLEVDESKFQDESTKILLWYTWWAKPWTSLPVRFFPTSQTWDLFKHILRSIPQKDVTNPEGLSTLARFALAPHTLPASILELLVRNTVGAESSLQSSTCVLAQHRNATWPPYLFRTHFRPLPKECLEKLVEDVNSISIPSWSGLSSKERMKATFPITHRGVSKDTVAHNLNILIQIDQIQANPAQTFLSTLVWFEAAGLTSAYRQRMCCDPRRDQLTRNEVQMRGAYSAKNFAEQLVLHPLPVYSDVRYVSGTDNVTMFQRNQESQATTLQWLSILTLKYGIEGDHFEQLYRTTVSDTTSIDDLEESIGVLLREMFQKIAVYLRNQYQQWASTSRIFQDVIPLADFFSAVNSKSRNRPQFSGKSIEGLAIGLAEANNTLQMCVADSLYLLLGITPENEGLEVVQIQEHWKHQRMPMPQTSIKEIGFMKSVYMNCMPDLANRLVTYPQDLVREDYQRPDELTTRAVMLRQMLEPTTAATVQQLYWFNDQEPLVSISAQDNQQNLANSAPRLMPLESLTRYDHVPYRDIQPRASGVRKYDLFTVANSSDHEGVWNSKKGNQRVHQELESFLRTPRTISARNLVKVDTFPGYSIIKIVPGQHPVLRAPGDERQIPVSQQDNIKPPPQPTKSGSHAERSSAMQENRKTPAAAGFDKPDPSARGTVIESIFSHNGQTWDQLDRQAVGSTITAKGFYLKKSEDGCWILLLGTASRSRVEQSGLVVWSILDRLRLFSLDLDPTVVEFLKSVVCLAVNPIEPCETKEPTQPVDDDYLAGKLSQIRSWSLRRSADDDRKYMAYLRNERVICEHLIKVLRSIDSDSKSKVCSLIEDLFNESQMDLKDLNNSSTVTLDPYWSVRFSYLLGIMAQDADHERRSQSYFSLELASDNCKHLLHELPQEETPNPEEHSAPISWEDDFGQMPFQNDDSAGSNGLGPEHPQISDSLGSAARSAPESRKNPNRLIAAHEHITQRKFRQSSVDFIDKIRERDGPLERENWVLDYSDSEDEDSAYRPRQKLGRHRSRELTDESNRIVEDNTRSFQTGPEEDNVQEYPDQNLDCPLDSNAASLFPNQWGYGRPLISRFGVLSAEGDHVPLYFVSLDTQALGIEYSDTDGLPIAFVFHKQLLKKSLEDFRRNFSMESADLVPKLLDYRKRLLQWMTDLIRSPLPKYVKGWFLDKLEHWSNNNPAPSMERDGEINLKVIARCIAFSLPSESYCRDLIREAFPLNGPLASFCKRKNDTYGIHIVRGGTLKELQRVGGNSVCNVCHLGYDALTRSKDNASMYLSILNQFSNLTWMVYVTGLSEIDDQLLKWLAEYTKAHPWRFVFLENTQTSWNFSENRDRCVYDHAPIPIERTITTKEDLNNPAVLHLRPHHIQEYPRVDRQLRNLEAQLKSMTWEDVAFQMKAFFKRSEGDSAGGPESIDCQDDLADSKDFRDHLNNLFRDPAPCLVLLCSPPGAGKSKYSEKLIEQQKKAHEYRTAFVDGSCDRLVNEALQSILNKEVPDPSKPGLLIIDEFHMLSENHKRELFDWLLAYGTKLQVLLIANRKDSKDEELLKELIKSASSSIPNYRERVKLEMTRLNDIILAEFVQEKPQLKHAIVRKIRRWIHCSRCIFGGQSVSLRNVVALHDSIAEIDSRRASKDVLVNHLLNKLPIISEASAEEFVNCFQSSFSSDTPNAEKCVERVRQDVKGPVSLMFQAALCTEGLDLGGRDHDYLDYVSYYLPRAYEAPPILRIAAWCCHMREMAQMHGRSHLVREMDTPNSLLGVKFVDQCGFPLQLRQPDDGDLARGLAFSWGGDSSKLSDVIDAVKRGHSVDWSDVHDKTWKHEPLKDSRMLVTLLSVCASPGKVLDALNKDNLCSLLRQSSPRDSLSIACHVLRNQCHIATAASDGFISPYRTAIWVAILHDPDMFDTSSLLELLADEDPGQGPRAPDIHWNMSESVLADTLIWASTNMQDMRTCYGETSPERKTRFVSRMLEDLCIKLLQNQEMQKVPLLYGGMFAPLLESNSHQQKRISLSVALSAEDCNPSWCSPIPDLWMLAHGRASSDRISHLWENHRDLLCFDNEKDEVESQDTATLHPILAGGVLATNGIIPDSLAEAIITGNGYVDLRFFSTRMESALELLAPAIQKVVSEDRQFAVRPPDLLACIEDFAERFRM